MSVTLATAIQNVTETSDNKVQFEVVLIPVKEKKKHEITTIILFRKYLFKLILYELVSKCDLKVTVLEELSNIPRISTRKAHLRHSKRKMSTSSNSSSYENHITPRGSTRSIWENAPFYYLTSKQTKTQARKFPGK